MTLTGFARGTASFVQMLAALLAVAGVAYRSTYYWAIPVAPGEPYGVADLLDLLFAVLLLAVSGICVLVGLAFLTFPRLEGRRRAYRPILVGIGSFVGYSVLHDVVPRLM